jgi:PAS domain S-box-containing protein
MRVLHVDDDAGFLKTAKAILELQGAFQVETAVSVEEAAEKMKKEEYDAVVSDYQMLGKDGLQFLEELRQKGNRIPFFIFTGKGREEVAIKALNLGADGYFNKSGPPVTVYGELAHGIRQIVDKRRAEQSFLKSEEKYRRLIETLREGIWVIDKDSRTTFVNPHMAEILGYDVEEMKGRHLFSFMDEHGVEIAKRLLERRKQGIKEQHDFEFLRKDGTRVYATLVTSPITDDNGNYIGALASVMDITERKKAEEALEQRHHSLATLNTVSIELASLPCDADIREFLAKRLREITGAAAVAFADYDAGNKTLVARLVEFEPGMQKEFTRLLGKSLGEIRCPVSEKDYREITKSVIGKRQKLTEATYGGIPLSVAAEIQKLLGVDRFIGIAYIIKGELYGTSLLAIKVGMPDPPTEMLESFGHIAAVSLRRRRAEARALENEERYRELAESISDVFFAMDKDFRYTYWNKESEKLTGISAKDAIGKSLTEVFPDAKGTRIEQFYKEALRTQKTQSHLNEYQVGGKDYVFELNAYPTKNGLSVFVKDVTEHTRMEEMLKSSEQKFRGLVEDSAAPIATIDLKGRLTYLNKALADLFCYSVQEMSSRAFKDFLHPADRGWLMRLFLKIIVLRRQPRKFEFRALRKDGAILHLTCKPTRLEMADKTVGFQAVLMDTTAEKRILTKAEKLNEKLSVVGGLTRHDVNNKLSTILNVSYLLKQRLRDNQTLELVKETESAVHQIEGMFEFARTYEKLGTEELTYADVEKVFNEAAMLFPSFKGIRIVNDCHGLTVLADSLLRQLFYNLIDNSLKHGEKVSQVRVHHQTCKGHLKLIYEDDGLGIPKAGKDKIFEESYGKRGGHGLYLIRKMCEVYRWTIVETGKQGKGARFVMTIPKANLSGKENYRIV